MSLFFLGTKVSRAAWGAGWPLTVDEGEVQLRGKGQVVFVAQGKVYALNRAAKEQRHILPFLGYRFQPIEEIWADDPMRPGTKLSLNKLINTGVALRE